MKKLLPFLLLFASAAVAQDIPNHTVPIGRGPGSVGWANTIQACTPTQVLTCNGSSADPTFSAITGLFPNESANTVFAGPTSGGAAAPTFRALVNADIAATGVALAGVNDTNVTIALSGSPTTALVNAATITLGWTGTLSVARGGTGDSGTAWTASTPTPTCNGGSGSFGASPPTIALRTKTLGKTMFVSIVITMHETENCTFVRIPLPSTPFQAQTLASQAANAPNNNTIAVSQVATDGNVYVSQNGGGVGAWSTGQIVLATGAVEIQ